MTTTFRLLADDGAELALHDFGGPSGAGILLWAHANGFCAQSYSPLLDALASHVRVLALDLRGHGLSAPASTPLERSLAPERLVADFTALLSHADKTFPGARKIGAGHSLGALLPLHAAPGASAADGAKLDALVLVEAAVFPPAGHPVHAEAHALTEDRVTKIPRRRAVFSSPDELRAALERLPAFAACAPADLLQHCMAALAQQPDGSYALRCAPAVEGFLYGQVMQFEERLDQYNRLRHIDVPTYVLGADPVHPGSTWVTRMQPYLRDAIPDSRHEVQQGAGHLAPLASPASVAAAIARWIRS